MISGSDCGAICCNCHIQYGAWEHCPVCIFVDKLVVVHLTTRSLPSNGSTTLFPPPIDSREDGTTTFMISKCCRYFVLPIVGWWQHLPNVAVLSNMPWNAQRSCSVHVCYLDKWLVGGSQGTWCFLLDPNLVGPHIQCNDANLLQHFNCNQKCLFSSRHRNCCLLLDVAWSIFHGPHLIFLYRYNQKKKINQKA